MSREFQHIIRISGTDLEGTQLVGHALTNIKGVGIRLANTIIERAGINSETRMGFLSEAEVKKIEDILEKPAKYGVSEWLLNRRKDRESGSNLHLIGSDLVLQIKTDIDQMKKMKSRKGFRHSHGLKVRGQRTRTTGRKGKAMGVKKKQVRER